MAGFTLDGFVSDARAAAASQDPLAEAERLMARVLADPDKVRAGVPHMDQDEVLLFEDDSVSIWHERFLPSEVLPPHEHRMPVVLGVYHGRERNTLWRRIDGALHPAGRLELAAGEYQVLGADAIHAVQALDDAPSLGLHIYLGPLTRVERSLFDWDDGAPRPMTDTNFEAMKRRV
ncbi:hypothetical protein ACW9UR_04225 [Halovulum sp. GXIMD14794]